MLPISGEISTLAVLNQVAVIIAIGIFLKLICERFRFPTIVALIVSGTLFASLGILNLESLGFLPDLIRVLALIIVVFANGFYLKVDTIKKEYGIVLPLATIGVLLTVTIIAGFGYFLLGLPLLIAAFMGAALGGTDPAAISSVLSKTPDKIQTVLNSESIMNQPLTVILPLVILDFLANSGRTMEGIGALAIVPVYLLQFFLLVGVGVIVGLVGFFGGQALLNYLRGRNEELAGLMIAIGVYVLAENFFGSGILAVGITSILLNSHKKQEKKSFREFNKEMAFLFTTFVFVMLGMTFTLEKLAEFPITRLEIVTILIAIFAARLLSVWVITFRTELNLKERLRLSLISPKGIAPAALAPLLLIVGGGIQGFDAIAAQTVVKIVYLAIIISILISLIVFAATKKKES